MYAFRMLSSRRCNRLPSLRSPRTGIPKLAAGAGGPTRAAARENCAANSVPGRGTQFSRVHSAAPTAALNVAGMPARMCRVKASSCRWPNERSSPAAQAGPAGDSTPLAAHASADRVNAAMLMPVKEVAATCMGARWW